MTDLNTAQRLAPQPVQAWASGSGPAGSPVVVDLTRRYQTMTGFGASMTDTSAWGLTNKLSETARRQTMTQLFSPDQGIGLSMLRQPMGASDFAVNGSYSYSAEVIGKHLGPALAKSGLKTQILAYDHNWDVPVYPEQIYNDAAAARYVPGTAWRSTSATGPPTVAARPAAGWSR